jgi:hypothetical protein
MLGTETGGAEDPWATVGAGAASPALDEPPPFPHGAGGGSAGALRDVFGGLYDDSVAEEALGGAREPLPHLDRIQAAFGRHDVRHARARIGGEAAIAAGAAGPPAAWSSATSSPSDEAASVS